MGALKLEAKGSYTLSLFLTALPLVLTYSTGNRPAHVLSEPKLTRLEFWHD